MTGAWNTLNNPGDYAVHRPFFEDHDKGKWTARARVSLGKGMETVVFADGNSWQEAEDAIHEAAAAAFDEYPGEEVELHANSTVAEAAQAYVAQCIAEEGTWVGQVEDMTIIRLLILPVLGMYRLRDVGRGEVTDWMYLIGPDNTNEAIEAHRVLTQVFGHAYDLDLIDEELAYPYDAETAMRLTEERRALLAREAIE